jgi:xanthine dehydrogenase YagR molybdenum-binding subunit
VKDRGDPIDRVDGRLKVTGAAPYAAEVEVADVAHAFLVTSPVATGRITGIATAEARKLPGVLAILTHENAPRLPPQPGIKDKPSLTDRVLQLLQSDRVLYSNQPVALVVADTLDRARHAAQRITVQIARAPVDVEFAEPRATLEKPTQPKSSEPSQIKPPDITRGDPAAGLAAAELRLSETYATPWETHNPMEMHATTAVWQDPEHLTIYDSTQGIFEVRRKLAATLGLAKENVRVISKYVGGGFGSKGSCWSHVVLAALAARQVRRPVKLMLTRPQMFGPVGGRPATSQRVTLGARKDGTLTLIRHESRSGTSRFDEFVEHVTAPTRALYACPNVFTSERLVRLDIGTPQFMRAPGESSGSFALESAMDELAYALNMDPLQLRLRNHADHDPETGKPWSSKSLKTCYQQAADRFGWARRDPKPGSMRDGDTLIGWGMATATYPASQRPAAAHATLRPDGTALVKAGSQDIGTGTYTIMTQIAADALELPIERVHFDLGDTEMPETPTSGGSATAASVGSAVRRACLALRDKLADLLRGESASPLHDIPAGELAFAGDRLVHKKSASRGEPLAALFKRHGLTALDAEFKSQTAESRKQYGTRSFGAQFVEVRVDPGLGQIRTSRVVSAFAAGRILNAKTARSQYLGGIVWGLSMGLHEQTVYDRRNGRIMNADFAEYHVPVNLDVPDIDVIFVDEHDPHVNEIGVKGIGEIGITGVAAALANAVFHATGKRIRDLPITLDKLL